MLTNSLRDRFGIVARLEFYTPEELTHIKFTRSSSFSRYLPTMAAHWKLPDARVVRHALPIACCGVCATLPRSRQQGTLRRKSLIWRY